MVQRHIRHSKESQLAENGIIKFATAIQRTYRRRESFGLARPCSALLLGFGSSFIYRDGILCYFNEATIRILDVHRAGNIEKVIDLHCISQAIWNSNVVITHTELLHYQDGVLAILFHNTDLTGETWLVALRTEDDVLNTERIKLVINCPGSRFWVRNDSQYLFVGSHVGLGTHGHHEWVLRGYNLVNGHRFEDLQLPNFFGTDIGQTVIFEISGDFLYAISNQSSAEMEEIDWTSYYHCYRFPVQDPSPTHLEPKQLWRRQHREGPINDSWTELSLCKDERTGTLLIVEGRREWKDGGSTQRRTYYRQPLIFPHTPGQVPDHLMITPPPTADSATTPAVPPSMALPVGDPLIGLLDGKSRPLYEAAHKRTSRDYHCEFANDAAASALQSFMLAKTKHRAYNVSCSAFLDLVIDDQAHSQRYWTQQIRLRIGSRIQASPIGSNGLLYQPITNDTDGTPTDDSEDRFTDRGINIWPSTNAPVELLDLLNPSPGTRSHLDRPRTISGGVRAISDERSIIYTAKEYSEKESAIVLVNFDPWIRFEGLTTLGTNIPSPETKNATRKVVLDERSGAYTKNKSRVTAFSGKSDDSDSSEAADKICPWFRKDRAMHVDIGKGFQFI